MLKIFLGDVCNQEILRRLVKIYRTFYMGWERIRQDLVVRLEGTYNDHLIQLSDQLKADQKLKHVFEGIVRLPLKH